VAHRFGEEIEGSEFVTPDPGLFSAIVRGVEERSDDLDGMLSRALADDWPLARLQSVLRAILRAGAWEILANAQIDAPIIIADYVQMTDAFFTDKEPAMTNAVLDRLRRELRDND